MMVAYHRFESVPGDHLVIMGELEDSYIMDSLTEFRWTFHRRAMEKGGQMQQKH